MLKQLQKRKEQTGFTIIEVLIVLAIAGLIMVVVFLAVPALQRSGRNNALNTDANNILAGVGTYVANNGGSLPTGIAAGFAAGGNAVTLTGAGANTSPVKLGGNVQAIAFNTAPAPGPGTPVGTVDIVTGAAGVCNATNTGLVGGGSTRSYAILYVAESGTAGANSVKCVGS